MPAFNAEKTLLQTYNDLPLDLVDDIILVDDASTDGTAALAQTLPIEVVVHPKNRGYGGNQKTCYKTALGRGADVVVMVHPDHQYDPTLVPELVKKMVDENYLAVFGSRMAHPKDALAGGMPIWKFIANVVLTKIGNLFLGLSLTEFHSGFRAYHRKALEQIDIEKNSDDFVFDTQIIIQLAAHGIKIAEIPIKTRYFDEASQIGLMKSIKYGLAILQNVLAYRLGLRKF